MKAGTIGETHELQAKFPSFLQGNDHPTGAPYTCALLQSATTQQEVRGIHKSLAATRDLEHNVVLANTLLQTYVRFNLLDESRQLSDQIPHLWSVFSWTSMITAFAQYRDFSQAMLLFHLMQLQGSPPNKVTILSIISASRCVSDIDFFHRIASEAGLLSDSAVKSSLISMYGKSKALDSAEEVFKETTLRDVIVWTSLITANVKCKEFHRAVKLFRMMQLDGCQPDFVSFVAMVTACSSLGCKRIAKAIHKNIIESGIKVDLILANAIVHMFGECMSITDACSAFASMSERDEISWNSIIGAHVQNNCFSEAMVCFRRMQQDGFTPTRVTYLEMLNAPLDKVQARSIHSQAQGSGLDSDVLIATGLVTVYGKAGCLNSASQAFEAASQRDVVLWTTLIAAYAQGDEAKRGVQLFRRMQLEGVKPNELTFVSVLESCSSPESLPDGKMIHMCVQEHGSGNSDHHTVVGNSLLSMYSKCGSMTEAKKTFDCMERRDVVSWNTMLAANALHESFEDGVSLYREMQLQGFKPDRVTFVTILDICTRMSSHRNTEIIHKQVTEAGFHTNPAVGAALVNAYGKCGKFEQSLEALKKIHGRDLYSWSAIVSAYAQRGMCCESLELFRLMQQDGVDANGIMYVKVLSTLSHEGRVEECCRYFGGLKPDHGIEPTLAHFGCVIDTLSRAGHLREADVVMKQAPSEDLVSWMTLLGGCIINRDEDQANRVAQSLIESNPGNPAAYIAVTNMLQPLKF